MPHDEELALADEVVEWEGLVEIIELHQNAVVVPPRVTYSRSTTLSRR